MAVKEMNVAKKIEHVVINSIGDIRKAVVPFMKEVPEGQVEFSSQVEWKEEDGQKQVTNVSAYSTNVSVRQKLLEGLDGAKDHMAMWDNIQSALADDEYGTDLPTPNADSLNLPVDRLIKHRLGGKREGMTVVWHVSGKKVVFDPFEKTLKEYDEEEF